jgi:hypothetical protein
VRCGLVSQDLLAQRRSIVRRLLCLGRQTLDYRMLVLQTGELKLVLKLEMPVRSLPILLPKAVAFRRILSRARADCSC